MTSTSHPAHPPTAVATVPRDWQLRLQDIRQRVLTHPLYDEVHSLERVRVFMEHHVFAVWDFMSLLKRLQQQVTCVSVPWLPPRHPALARFVNEIVLGEETDEDGRGGYASHFDLYRSAMLECGARVEPIDTFLQRLAQGDAIDAALNEGDVPPVVRSFVSENLRLARDGAVPCVAAAFFFGREDVIPDMFARLAPRLQAQGQQVDRLVYYMQRHIELDGDQHGPLAERLLAELCGDDATAWEQAAATAHRALELRLHLWDAVLQAIRSL